MGVPEGKEKGKKLERYLKKIMKENFPDLVKEIDYASPGSTESPKQDARKEAHSKTHHN